MKLLKTNKGEVLITSMIFVSIILFAFFVIYRIAIVNMKVDLRHSLVFACESAIKNTVVGSNNIKTVDYPNANAAFYKYLQLNFGLDSSNKPDGSKYPYISGQINIIEITYYDINNVSFPFSPPHTSTIFNYPTIHVVIEVPVTFPIFNFTGHSTQNVMISVDVEAEDI